MKIFLGEQLKSVPLSTLKIGDTFFYSNSIMLDRTDPNKLYMVVGNNGFENNKLGDSSYISVINLSTSYLGTIGKESKVYPVELILTLLN